MIAPPRPPDEERRLSALHALGILDTEPEGRFDRITRLAQRLFETQMVSISLIDAERQWKKSIQGPLDREGPRDEAFCAYAILEPDSTLVVGDATADERFAGNPAVTDDPNIRFYAGHPIAAPGGEPLGTLCVVDDAPRDAETFDAEALRDLAAMVEQEIASLTLAIGDELTGLSNRRGFELLGQRAYDAAQRLDLPIAALYADLDNMKPINDEHGHDAGDRALAEVARLLEENLREGDVLARMGGDEFCALLVGAAAAPTQGVGLRIQSVLDLRNLETEEPFPLSLSFGVALREPGEPGTLESLVAEADARMMKSKRARGGGR